MLGCYRALGQVDAATAYRRLIPLAQFSIDSILTSAAFNPSGHGRLERLPLGPGTIIVAEAYSLPITVNVKSELAGAGR